jgi:hypothetical protein
MEDEEDIAQMQKDLAKAEQQKAELENLQKMQGGWGRTPEKAGLNFNEIINECTSYSYRCKDHTKEWM